MSVAAQKNFLAVYNSKNQENLYRVYFSSIQLSEEDRSLEGGEF